MSMLEETFPHQSEDGYHIHGLWQPIVYYGLYPNTVTPPEGLTPNTPESRLVSNFMMRIQKLHSESKLATFRCFLYYENSMN